MGLPRIDTGMGKSLATLGREVMLVAIAVDVTRADHMRC
jgi:hypothetical protein